MKTENDYRAAVQAGGLALEAVLEAERTATLCMGRCARPVLRFSLSPPNSKRMKYIWQQCGKTGRPWCLRPTNSDRGALHSGGET
jgi:hypothetical protein